MESSDERPAPLAPPVDWGLPPYNASPCLFEVAAWKRGARGIDWCRHCGRTHLTPADNPPAGGDES